MKFDTLYNWRLAGIIFACATLYFWNSASVTEHHLSNAYSHLGNIEDHVEELESDIERFSDENWRDVVPDVRRDVQELRKLMNSYKEKIELEELEQFRNQDRP